MLPVSWAPIEVNCVDAQVRVSKAETVAVPVLQLDAAELGVPSGDTSASSPSPPL